MKCGAVKYSAVKCSEWKGVYLMGGTVVRRLGAVLTSGNWAYQPEYCRLGWIFVRLTQ